MQGRRHGTQQADKDAVLRGRGYGLVKSHIGSVELGFSLAIGRRAMTRRLETVGLSTPLTALMDIFNRGFVAIVVDQGKFWGLITRIDVLNYLRHKAP